MLKFLFTSNTRVKLLNLFLLNPEGEYYVRELTRRLDEQINSIRRELDNLKRLGLLKVRTKNRHKFYTVNQQFILYPELRNIILKSSGTAEHLIHHICKMGKVDYLLISGIFIDRVSQVDLLVVGEVDKDQLAAFLDTLEAKSAIKFSILSTENFLYRLKCRDKFTLDLIEDPQNIIGVNKLEKHLE